MELNDVALALFVEEMKERPISGMRSQTSVENAARTAFEHAKVFMSEAAKHQPAPGASKVSPLNI